MGMPLDPHGETLHLPGGYSVAPVAEQSAPIVKGTLKAAPRIRNVYWCGFPRDMRQPEFWKTSPVVVISHQNLLTGPILVVPMTTKPQHGDRWGVVGQFQFRRGRNS
jgi:hypothetical protein